MSLTKGIPRMWTDFGKTLLYSLESTADQQSVGSSCCQQKYVSSVFLQYLDISFQVSGCWIKQSIFDYCFQNDQLIIILKYILEKMFAKFVSYSMLFLKFLVKISDSLVLWNELKLSCFTRPQPQHSRSMLLRENVSI